MSPSVPPGHRGSCWKGFEGLSPALTPAPDAVLGPVLCLQVSGFGGPDDEVLQVTPGQGWAASNEEVGTEVWDGF